MFLSNHRALLFSGLFFGKKFTTYVNHILAQRGGKRVPKVYYKNLMMLILMLKIMIMIQVVVGAHELQSVDTPSPVCNSWFYC